MAREGRATGNPYRGLVSLGTRYRAHLTPNVLSYCCAHAGARGWPELTAAAQGLDLGDFFASTAGRFRHGTRPLRWRPDKAPGTCTVDQIEQNDKTLALFD